MRVALSLIVFAACLALCACADPTCTAAVTFKARQGDSATWYVGAVRYQIWDITVQNSGTCPLTKVVAFFTLSAGGFISESWNYDSTSGLFSSFGSVLNVGQSFYGAGMVLANHSSIALSTVNPPRYGCPESCFPAATTQAPTTAAPVTTKAPTTTAPVTTKAPTTAAPVTTKAPTTTAPVTTKAPTTVPPTTTAPGTCAVTASMTRDNYWWMDAGRNTSVYRLAMTNAGPCALQAYYLSFNLGSGALLSYWNLQNGPVTGGWSVTGFGPTLAPGYSFNAAGIIVAGGPDKIAISSLGSRCAC